MIRIVSILLLTGVVIAVQHPPAPVGSQQPKQVPFVVTETPVAPMPPVLIDKPPTGDGESKVLDLRSGGPARRLVGKLFHRLKSRRGGCE